MMSFTGSRLCTMIFLRNQFGTNGSLFSFARNSGPMPFTVETTFDVLFALFSIVIDFLSEHWLGEI